MIIYCMPHNEAPNCFKTYRQKAIADIQSERKCDELEAADMLLDSDPENPIHLSDVDYWVEQ